MRFFTSDTHFGHRNIIQYCNRPFRDVDHMNEMLIKNWNDTVAPDDIVYHLGDVALGPWSEWDGLLSRLNGKIYLIVGNHDRIFKGESQKNQDKFSDHYKRWFVKQYDSYSLGWRQLVFSGPDDTNINLSHFPYDGDSHGEERYREFRLKDEGEPLIHGHTHDANQRATVSKRGTPMFHVGMDAWDYRPVPETEIVSWLRSL